jgi:ankyrin repeat protein
LHFASSVEIAAYLLDHGAEIDARDIDHESTPAQYMLKDRTGIARYLVSRGAETDIFMAAALGDLELVRKHLDANSEAVLLSVSEKDLPKQNPESGGHIYIFTLGWGKTPHTLAWEFGHKEVFQLLMERSPWWLQLTQACEVGDEALAHELSRSANTLPPEAASRIVGAAARNDARAVHLMLEAGWPADARGQHDQTALHWAAWRGNTSLVRELLHHNAPLDARESSYSGTPLDWALHASKNNGPATPSDYAETIQALDPINNIRPGLHP